MLNKRREILDLPVVFVEQMRVEVFKFTHDYQRSTVFDSHTRFFGDMGIVGSVAEERILKSGVLPACAISNSAFDFIIER